MPSNEQDKAGVVTPPPLIYLVALVLGLLLNRKFPTAFLPRRRIARSLRWPPPNIVEVGFSELWCAIGRASLLLRSGPRFRHVHRSKLLEDA